MSAPTRSTHAGFTLIELLVAIAITSILTGILLPAVQKIDLAASQLERMPRLAPIAQDIHFMTRQTTAGVQAFLLRVGEPELDGDIPTENLTFLCQTGTHARQMNDQLTALSASPELPAVQRRLLGDVRQPIAEELLPAVQRLLVLLHRRTDGFCRPE